ncbi:MAG: response regulator transcription factor [Pyrinomonadaceae bacterium]
MSYRILAIDSRPLILRALQSLADENEGLVLEATASNGEEGLRLFARLRPDITVLALRLADFCAAEHLNRFFEIDPTAKILVLANEDGEAEMLRTHEAGALGIVAEDVSAEVLAEAISAVGEGKEYIPKEICASLKTLHPSDRLTETESEVIRMLVGGMLNKEIAFAMDVSENTIKTHLAHIYAKLGVNDRTSATVRAIRLGLVRLN